MVQMTGVFVDLYTNNGLFQKFVYEAVSVKWVEVVYFQKTLNFISVFLSQVDLEIKLSNYLDLWRSQRG